MMKFKGLKEFLVALLVILLPNALMFWLSSFLGVARPWVNCDYVLAAFVFIFAPTILSCVVLFIFIVLDAVAVLGQVLPFLKFQDALYLLKFLPATPASYQVVAAAALIFSFLIVWVYVKSNNWVSQKYYLLAVNVFVVAYAYSAIFEDVYKTDRIWRVVDNRIIESQLLFNIEARTINFVDKFWLEGEPLEPAKYDGITAPLLDGGVVGSGRLMLVVAESWGVSSPEIMKEVLSPLFEKSEEFESISLGELPFEGVTIEGEFRELCGLTTRHFNLRVSNKKFEECLPHKLRRLGYRTKAMHAAAGTMYDRSYWYPKVGFSESTFFETRQWRRRCYSFPGGCDSELLGEISEFFSSESNGFLYWLTLNSHYFYDERDIVVDVFDCDEFGLMAVPQVCRNLKLQAQFFHHFSLLLDSPDMEGVDIIIVGDHVPVFSSAEVRDEYFKENLVPWIKIST